MDWFNRKWNGDLRKHYTLIFEGALAIALLLVLTAFKVEFRVQVEDIPDFDIDDDIVVEVPDRTVQTKTPPAPPKPQVPVAVPNDRPIEDDINIFNPDDFLEGKLPIPSQPPQDQPQYEEPVIRDFVQKMPEPVGGMKSILSKIEYPELARKGNIEGRVVVQFVVDEQGKVTQTEVIRGIGGGCDEEALRVVKAATFTPGIQNGIPVKVRLSVSVLFRLQN